MKYICMEDQNGVQLIFVFPRTIDHDCMEEVISRIKNKTTGEWERVWRTPISAGFVSPTGNCYGESITLNLESRPDEDTKLLNDQQSCM